MRKYLELMLVTTTGAKALMGTFTLLQAYTLTASHTISQVKLSVVVMAGIAKLPQSTLSGGTLTCVIPVVNGLFVAQYRSM